MASPMELYACVAGGGVMKALNKKRAGLAEMIGQPQKSPLLTSSMV
jgi:hypothetical protein